MVKRKRTRVVSIGGVRIGGDHPIAVQSMTNTRTADVTSTVSLIKRLEDYGCELIRIAVPDDESAAAIPLIKKDISIPLIADIHFKADLALKAIKNGADKIRINPGTIGRKEHLSEIISTALEYHVPIRIGVNAGSLPKDILAKYGAPCPEALFETVSRYISLFEKEDFSDLVIALKAFDIRMTIDAYTLYSRRYDYPAHIGITEAGPVPRGVVRSSLGIGLLLLEGIGDTLRVSLTAPPEQEIIVAYEILRSLGIRQVGPALISCPTCARTSFDLIDIVAEVEKRLQFVRRPLKVAVMGCEVNGPGEAKMADVGIACGKTDGILFVRGEIVERVTRNNMVDKLIEKVVELDDLAASS